jgi:lysophospholipase L1-like esterase
MKRIGIVARLVLSLLFVAFGMVRASAAGDHWVGTWATAVVTRPQAPPAGQAAPAPVQMPLTASGQPNACQPAAFGPGPGPAAGRGNGQAPPPLNFKNQTLREIVHVSLGGDRVRVVFSNAFGTIPLEVGAAHVALREKDASIQVKSGRPLTFGGSPSTMIAAGAVAVSDPVSLTVAAATDLAIDIYLPGDTAASTSPLTTHQGANQGNYISAEGNHAGEADFVGAATTQSWFFLARVEVAAPETVGAVVTFGDSITDGLRSTPNTNNRWPDELARRLVAAKMPLGVLNQGISGNRVLCDGAGVSALARFDRDVLVQSGAKYVVVLESINDIGIGRASAVPSANDLIAAHRQLIDRAHALGLTIYGATLTPFDGAAYFTQEGEAKRQAVNAFIRTGKAYDGVIDFDAAVRDPMAPSKIQMKYNPGDNLHMNDAGYQAMAAAIDVGLFKK